MTQISKPRPVELLNVAPFLFWRENPPAWDRVGDVLEVRYLEQARDMGCIVIKLAPRSVAWRWLEDWTAKPLPRDLGIVSWGRWVSLVDARVRAPEDAEPEFWIAVDGFEMTRKRTDLDDDALDALRALADERSAARLERMRSRK